MNCMFNNTSLIFLNFCYLFFAFRIQLSFGYNFNDLLVTFFLLCGVLVAKWDPGPKNLEKGDPKPTDPTQSSYKSSVLGHLIFSILLSTFFGRPFCDLGGQSVPNEGPSELLSTHFGGNQGW